MFRRNVQRSSGELPEQAISQKSRSHANGVFRGIGERPNKQRTPDAAKAVIGQFPASVMTLALLAGYSQPHKKRIDAIKIVYLPS